MKFLKLLIRKCLLNNIFYLSLILYTLPSQSSQEALSKIQIVRGSIARLYWARVLLEDYERWPKALELVRFVAQNDDSLPSPVLKKLRKVSDIIQDYVPEAYARKFFNFRHLVRPFLEAQYLINESLMDLRVTINLSEDSEILYIEDLLKSYFFPGQETQGIIEYPKEASYGFDLYALTPVNLAAARLDPSNLDYPKVVKPRPIPIPSDPTKPTNPTIPGNPTIPINPNLPIIIEPPQVAIPLKNELQIQSDRANDGVYKCCD
jgi:hypothetical protein